MEAYATSDLARECGTLQEQQGVRVTKSEAQGREILRVQIKSAEAAARIGKPCGRYVTVACPDLAGERGGEELCRVLAVEMREMAERLVGKRIDGSFSVLAVGLGNAAMTPDALGPQTVSYLSPTRHSPHLRSPLLGARLCELAAFSPGVSAQTGLETVELVRGAAAAMHPDLVLAVDALAARETAHLAATVQLADTGIQPGSGTGRARPALTSETVGVPVMAIGVPTVVGSATLVGDALARFGIDPATPEFADLIRGGESFFVTPKEIDLLIPSLAAMLAAAIERAFSVP